jgi:hypothetical protein
VKSVDFDAAVKKLTARVDFTAGTRFSVLGHEGMHPASDTVAKDYRSSRASSRFRADGLQNIHQ